MDVPQQDIFYDTVNTARKCSSFHSVGQGEGKVSQKRRRESLKGIKGSLVQGDKEDPWYRVTLIGQIPGQKAAKLCGGGQSKAVKRQGENLWVCQQKDQVTCTELQVLHPPGAHCHWKLLFVLLVSFYLSLALGSGVEPITQLAQREKGDKPCGKSMCMSLHLENVM